MLTIPNEVLKSLTQISAPPPWRVRSFAVGGLWAVGFATNSDLLLVASANGRGVFDAVSGERVARDPDDYNYDAATETVAGIGPLAGSGIEVNEPGGGIATRRALPLASHDGWVVVIASLSLLNPTPCTSGVGNRRT